MSFKKHLEEQLVHVPNWPTPEGMGTSRRAGNAQFGGVGTVENPTDPDRGDGAAVWELTDAEMEEYKREIAAFGGAMYLDRITATALNNFEGSEGWKAGRFTKQGVRWALRPPVTNKLAGGVPNSYHKLGQAIDIKHIGQDDSVATRKAIIKSGLEAGLRGFGFGKSQTHIDTRNTGLMVYTYNYNDATAHQAVEELIADYGLTGEIRYNGSRTDPKNTGLNSRSLMSTADTTKLVNAITRPPVVAEPEVPVIVGPGTEEAIEDEAEPVADDVAKKMPAIEINSLTAMAIGGILVAGFFGIRGWFKRREERKEAERLMADQRVKMMLARIRRDHPEFLARARRDPLAAEQLNRMIDDALAGGSSYSRQGSYGSNRRPRF